MRAKRVWKKEAKSSKMDLMKSEIAVVRAILGDLVELFLFMWLLCLYGGCC